ncbi:MAG: hypothetical protein ACTSO7_11230 [Candidatus Heimdallarchaeota archaeon]
MSKTMLQKIFQLKFIFYLEALVNSATLIMCIFFPVYFLGQFSSDTVPIVGVEIVRWYGILLFVITFILVGVLIKENLEAVKIVLLGYLIGDFAQIGVTLYLALTLKSWSFAVIFAIVITVLLIVFRILALAKPEYLGIKRKNEDET